LKTNRNLFQLCLLGSLLLGKIHFIQSKAKLKYAGNIVNKLQTDTLSKITAQHSADLQTALDAYKQSKVAQQSQLGDATTLRNQLAALVDSFAVPAARFDLPLNRPLNP
jgi:uncharacterized protein YaaW (UPF0174 family)